MNHYLVKDLKFFTLDFIYHKKEGSFYPEINRT